MSLILPNPSVRTEVDLTDLIWLDQSLDSQKGNRMTLQRPQLHLLLVDDDPLFLKTMERVAKREKIAVTRCRSLGDVESFAMPGIFDAAIVDYYLDGMERDLKGTRLAGLLGQTPTILVSRRKECIADGSAWPRNVRYYMNKDAGPEAILRAALKFRKGVRQPA